MIGEPRRVCPERNGRALCTIRGEQPQNWREAEIGERGT